MNVSLRSTLFLLLAAGFLATASSFDKDLQARSEDVAGSGEASPDDSVAAQPKLVRISGNIDGSGRIVFARGKMQYIHHHWTPPANMMLDGDPWHNLNETPPTWSDYSHRLDLTKAWIVKRKGRDTIALEHTPDGFELHLNDSVVGAEVYEVTIAVPRRR